MVKSSRSATAQWPVTSKQVLLSWTSILHVHRFTEHSSNPIERFFTILNRALDCSFSLWATVQVLSECSISSNWSRKDSDAVYLDNEIFDLTLKLQEKQDQKAAAADGGAPVAAGGGKVIPAAQRRVQKDLKCGLEKNTWCQMEFPNPDDIMNFNVTLLPDEVNRKLSSMQCFI